MSLKYPGRCPTCYMRSHVCICSLIPEFVTPTKLTVIMHHRESYKTTNTGRIACLSLKNSEIHLRGLQGSPLNCAQIIDEKYQPLLLTLHEKSVVLSKDYLAQFNKPIQLIVPDGNWRQASKMGKRDPALADIPWVRLTSSSVDRERKRMRAEHLHDGMSTIEAIARAYGVIEGPHIETALDELFVEMATRTLATRPASRP